jgi:recombination protein RecA
MAKKKAAAENIGNGNDLDFCTELAELAGGDVLDMIDSVSYLVDTGNLALNYVCSGKFFGGGIPGGKLTEIYGPNSSSKSLIGSNILFGCQKTGGIAVLIDAENAANKSFIKKASHCDTRRIVRFTPATLEDVFAKIYKVIELIRAKKGIEVPIVILYDSITVSPSARELREVDLPEEYTKEQFKKIVGGNEQPGERAKICSRELRKLNAIMEKNNATVIILNQTRDKIGGFAPMGMQPKVTGGGGNALPFYASLRLETKTQKKIEKKITAKKNRILGINIKVKNIKNRSYRPYVETEGVQLLFDKGINPISGLLSCLLDADRLEVKSAGNFTVKEPWAGGKEVKFKASMERNDIPLEVLYNCPALIDAESEEQIRNYLEPFMDAIESRAEDEENVLMNNIEDDDEEELDDEIDELE